MGRSLIIIKKGVWSSLGPPSPMLLGICNILTHKHLFIALFFNFLAHCEKDACYAFVGKNIYKSYVYVFSYIARYYLNNSVMHISKKSFYLTLNNEYIYICTIPKMIHPVFANE